jgi:hypothetical protein
VPEDLRADLARLGELRARVKRDQREAMLTARELLPIAHAAGLSTSEISRLANMSRGAVLEYLPVDPRRQRTRRLTS